MYHYSTGSSHPLRVAVFGVGAIGGYFGGILARTGHDVNFIARGDTAAALRQRGLRIESGTGDFLVHPAQVFKDPAQVGSVELVIPGVKAWQLSEVGPMLNQMLTEGSAVLPLQNGVGTTDDLVKALGQSHVLGGVAKIFCYQVAPGHVRHDGATPTLVIGELDNRASKRLKSLQEAFQEAGVNTEVPEDIHIAIWSKFLMITSVSGVGTAERVAIGKLRTERRTRRLLINSMIEIETLAHSLGITLADDIVASTLDFVDSLPAHAMPSMQRDFMDARPSELGTLLSTVRQLGKTANLNLPVNRALCELLFPLE